MEKGLVPPEDSHQKLYILLCEAEDKYKKAITAATTVWPSLTDPGVVAGQIIFETTIDAILNYKWEGNLPVIEEYPGSPTDPAVLPPPVLAALGYCLDNHMAVCLAHLGLTSGQTMFDRAVLAWPTTLLYGLSPKTRLFMDMSELYHGQKTAHPLLSDTQARTIQLLVIGRHLINRHKKKIGLPLHPKLHLP